MNEYNKKEIYKKVKKSIHFNSDTLSEEMCYYLCANKEVFDTLMDLNHQIIIGRRGTGKTTLLKAFTHYINQQKNNQFCWYVKLDSCIPNDSELYQGFNPDNVVRYAMLIFLKELGDFLSNLYNKRAYTLGKVKSSILEDKILNFLKIVSEGSPIIKSKNTVQKNSKNEKTKTEGLAKIKAEISMIPELCGSIGISKKNEESDLVSTTIAYNYIMGLNDIKILLTEILELLGVEMLYICIDEFCMIDRDISYTIQPKVAQCLKQLFFSSQLITVKIATVWNALRMQHRQIDGLREGIEIGNDINKNSDLDLDRVYYLNQDKAFSFFKDAIYNQYKLGNIENTIFVQNTSNDEFNDTQKNYIVNEMFSNNAFECLVCASQGNPRMFSILLLACIKKAQERNASIRILDVFEAVVEHYSNEIRQRIPYSLPICVAIDDYITKTHNRIFLVKIEDYNNAVHHFDGLVANGALNQYPSAQLPRTLRNNYKMFIVHYGNYLDSFGDGLKTLIAESKINDFSIFPKMVDDDGKKWRRFVLELPKNYDAEMYCTYCHRTFPNNKEETIKICPKCNSKIAYWY